MTSNANLDADTIVAIATTHGVGSISIIRLSGSQALEIATTLTTKNLTPRYAHLCNIAHQQEFIDEAIVIYFKSPHSFTGEDIVEIQCHGGVIVSKLILEACTKCGARLALAGEFSKRAFLNGKMDLSKIESIASLITSQSEQEVKLIAGNLKGELKDFLDKVRRDLVEVLAFSEVSIDYGEEDLPEDLVAKLFTKLQNLSANLTQIKTSNEQRLHNASGHKIALIGKPNVGKSSLLNELLKYERAIVSDEEGTTRDTIEENILLGTHLVRLIDTAGIRETSSEVETTGIGQTKQTLQNADLILALFDGSHPLDENDQKVLDLLANCDEDKIIYVFTKSDLSVRCELDKPHSISISTKTKDTQDLLEVVKQKIAQNTSYSAVILTSTRQVSHIENTISHIANSYEFLQNEELEFFSFHIQEAISELAKITHSYEHSELLDEMFTHFCLGK